MRLPVLLLAGIMTAAPVVHTQKFRNEKVDVVEGVIQPGETEALHGHPASVAVYFEGGTIEVTAEGGKPRQMAPRRGDVVFRPPQRHIVKNAGAAEVRSVRIDFLTDGAPQAPAWGAAGLSPNYKLLFENRYARAYDIHIPAGTKEPQHTHKDRVVVCLSGAELEHIFPDGRTEVSTLKTGEVAWRRGGTHIGHNLGKTDLWVIAIEPK
jgi:oxalate decarboxylase/phosphoglucose isomerase-like protein (cupin superfamily)